MTDTTDNYKALVVAIKAARDTVGILAIEIRPNGTVFIIPPFSDFAENQEVRQHVEAGR
jgi:hypothetical protein